MKGLREVENAVVAVEESCVLDVKSGTVLIISSGSVLVCNCSLKARARLFKSRLTLIPDEKLTKEFTSLLQGVVQR